MSIRILTFLLSLLITGSVSASGVDSLYFDKKVRHDPLPKFAFSFKFGLADGNVNSTSYELSADWYPLRYIGVGLGVELDDNHGNGNYFSGSSWINDEYSYDPKEVLRLNFHPMLAFRTPIWYFSKNKDWGFMLQCKPGLCLSVPQNDSYAEQVWDYSKATNNTIPYEWQSWKNRNGEWLAWRLLTALSISSSDCAFSIGWSISNYNIMSCRNNLYHNGKRVGGAKCDSPTNTIFVSVSLYL